MTTLVSARTSLLYTPAMTSMLAGDHGLADVEGLMQRLAVGKAHDHAATIILDHLASGGKRLRARLALAANEALGKKASDAVAWAAACEMLHNATLVHDDLQDGDRVRRGRPTSWVTFGSAQAINAGDLMFQLPYAAISTLVTDDGVKWRLASILARQSSQVIRGQVDELEMTTRMEISWPVYDQAIIGKTSALFELPVEGAAVLCGHSDVEAAQLTRPFRALGMLFQMQDDVLDLFADKGRESRGSDVREGKVSALVVDHVTRHPSERDWLVGILKTPREQTTQQMVDQVIERFQKGGALQGVCERIDKESSRAVNAPELAATPRLATLMRELVKVIVEPIAAVMRP